jgi:hypothetical protein
MGYVLIVALVIFILVAVIFMGREEGSRHPILVGKLVEFYLEENKRVCGKVTSQQEDRLVITWVNPRGETRHTQRTIDSVTTVERA